MGDSGEGASYDTEVELTNVKIDDKKTLIQTSEGMEQIGNAIMFYDLQSSNGLTNTPINHSKVEFKGKEYHIVDFETLYVTDTAHHYEIILK